MDRSIFQDKDVSFEQRRVYRIASIVTRERGGGMTPTVSIEEAQLVIFKIRGREVGKRYMRISSAGNPTNQTYTAGMLGTRGQWHDTKGEALAEAKKSVVSKIVYHQGDLEKRQQEVAALDYIIAKEIGTDLEVG